MSFISLVSYLNTSMLICIFMTGTVACSDVKVDVQLIPVKEKTFQISIDQHCPQGGNTFSDTYAHNFSAPLEYDRHMPDSDADGLTDEYEQTSALAAAYNLDMAAADTNDDGYSDYLVNLLGRDMFSQSFFKTCMNKGQDTDQDGITDCDEDLVKTDVDNPDTDNDGIPDGIEIRYGTNPLDPVDSSLDPDHDGSTNLEEIKSNTPINYSNDIMIDSKEYGYKVLTTNVGSTECYSITISNIPHMNMEENLVKVFVLENKTIGNGGGGQGQQLFIQTVTVLVPQGIADGDTIHIGSVMNQTIESKDVLVNTIRETDTK